MAARTSTGFWVWAALQLTACSSSPTHQTPYVCSFGGCRDDVSVELKGALPAGRTYHVELSTDAGLESAPLAECTLTASDSGELLLACTSDNEHSERGSTILLENIELPSIHVTITEGTSLIKEQSLPLSYYPTSSNGTGCGACMNTVAPVSVSF
jgi:hypothetical protein